MAKVLQNITSILLAGIVLISSTGINLHKHSCSKQGISEVVILLLQHDCCEEMHEEEHCHDHNSNKKQNNSSEEQPCCDSENFFIKTEIENNNFSIDNFVLVVFWTIAPKYFWKIYPLENNQFLSFADSSPPLKLGQEQIILYQKLRL